MYRFINFSILLLVLLTGFSFAQNEDSLYFKNFIYNSDNSLCTEKPPTASFTVFLNRDESKILIENAPRWDPTGDNNITGNGTFGVELANFINPAVQIGDSVFARFTDNSTGEQGIVADYVDNIPWIRFPLNLMMEQVNLPLPPQNIFLIVDGTARTINWNFEAGNTYNIYRRTLEDTLNNGSSRNLYTRIAEGLTGGSYTDNTGEIGKTYGYIVYAFNGEGVVSSHSEEVNENTGTIENLTVTASARNTFLNWDEYNDPEVNGYNIYRRKEGETYESPVGFAGTQPKFRDSRLEPGVTYFYKVKARYDYYTEVAFSPEEEVTTDNSSSNYYTYANLKIAVAIYKNTNAGSISNDKIEEIKNGLNLGKLFYWRNSKLKLNVEFTYYEIDEYISWPDPDDSWGSMLMTAEHLADRGVVNTQYDIVFRITPGINGYWSYGVQNLPFDGPSRKTGFSQVQWPMGTGVIYPGNDDNVHYGLIWVFVHEVQHAIDALYNANGEPEMYHGDIPWEFPVPCGEHFDFQAKMFRTFTHNEQPGYEQLLPNWGDIYEAVDEDNDDLPDNDDSIILNENIFGTLSNNPDSDNDGLSDRDEAIDGTFTGSDPNKTDSDGDGKLDGEDNFPRYATVNVIPNYTPVIDGIIDAEWQANDSNVNYSTYEEFAPKLYFAYDEDSLYIGIYTSDFAVPKFTFDWQNDGWWWGAGNTIIEINPITGNYITFRSWDASEEVKNYSLNNGGPGGMWDDDPEYQSQFNRKVIYSYQVRKVVNNQDPIVQIEIAIAKRNYAGLTLQPGDDLAVNVYYSAIDHNVNNATSFDQYSFVPFTLAGTSSAENEKSQTVSDFKLQQNYPNPFNPSTIIEYQVAKASKVTLTIYNIIGEKIKTLVNGYQEQGSYKINWDGKNSSGYDVPSGIYLYQMRISTGLQFTKKMTLIR